VRAGGTLGDEKGPDHERGERAHPRDGKA